MSTSSAEIIALSGSRTVDNAQLRALYTEMVTIRAVEEKLLHLFSEGLLRGTVHTCLGQEAIAAGAVGALDKSRDIVCSNHRGHGHYLAWCGDIEGLIAEIMGLPAGVCGGVGGSQHLHRKNYYSNGILGGMSPVATGMALAEKMKGSGAVTMVFHGDGAMAEGAIYEAMNIASLWSLPVLFAIEKNQFAQSTPIAHEIAGSLTARAEAFRITAAEIDGNDVQAVNEITAGTIEEMRQDSQPRMLVFDTWRLGPHSKGDDDRDEAEIKRRRLDCPISRAKRHLDADWCAQTEETAEKTVNEVASRLSKGAAA